MRFRTLLALLVFPLLAGAVDLKPEGIPQPQPLELKPFVATYDVRRGEKIIGESTMTLSKADGNRWTLVTETHGTAGMARLLGLDVREESHFNSPDNASLQSIDYRYRQDATLKSKQRHIEFDWGSKEARVTDKDELFRYALQPFTIDRHLVVLALASSQHLAARDLRVANKDAVEQQRFERRESKTLNLRAGEYPATRYERTDKPGKGSSWYTPTLPAPLQVEQLQKDGNNIVMELKAFR
jgi:hypothetical protein